MSMILSGFSELSLPCSILYVTIITYLLNTSQDNKYTKEILYEPEEYDFIIVGAGSAGCVLANRLTEISKWNVLLLEVGKEEPLLADIPGFALPLEGTDINWNYRTQPDENSCIFGKGCVLPRGKVMGGSSTLNFMIYIRGNAEDYNAWARLGNPGWSYNDILPYFKKSEDNRDEDIVKENPEYHSTGGYQKVQRFPYLDPNGKILLQGLEELGYGFTDVNAKSQLGSTIVQSTSYNGSRQSTNGAFIRPIREKRSNLFIRTRAYVTKILIDPKTKRANGVEYTSPITGDIKRVMAKTEVIVSAGAINSPKLLMLSGIGPIDELEKHGISVIKNLSVGHNLQDHSTFRGIFCQVEEKTLNNFTCPRKVKDLNYYLKEQRGPLSGIGVTAITAFFRTKYEQSQMAPDIQLHFSGFNVVPAYYNQFIIVPVLLTPKSRGFVKLNDTNPIWGAPVIQPRYFAADLDKKRLLEGVQMALELFNTTAFKKNNFKFVDTPLPPCNQFKFNSDEYWLCLMRHYTQTIFHPVGTCKMGPKEDTEAVVDSSLHVHGINGLRVIDASIMPVVIRGNTNAPIIMIAEKASDMIKQEWL